MNCLSARLTIFQAHCKIGRQRLSPPQRARPRCLYQMMSIKESVTNIKHKRHYRDILFTERKKFRSQTSDNMDRWKSRGGNSQPEEEKKKEYQRRERVRRNTIKVREKVEKSRNIVFFQMLCGSGGSKSRLAKAAGAEPSAEMKNENLHALWCEAQFDVKMIKLWWLFPATSLKTMMNKRVWDSFRIFFLSRFVFFWDFLAGTICLVFATVWNLNLSSCMVLATFGHVHIPFCMGFPKCGRVHLPFCMVCATFWHVHLTFCMGFATRGRVHLPFRMGLATFGHVHLPFCMGLVHLPFCMGFATCGRVHLPFCMGLAAFWHVHLPFCMGFATCWHVHLPFCMGFSTCEHVHHIIMQTPRVWYILAWPPSLHHHVTPKLSREC